MKNFNRFLASCILLFGTWCAQAQTPPPPNIVFILVDDLSNFETTPQSMPALFSNIVDKGVELTKFYVPQSLCCPARSNFLTGRLPHKIGMIANQMEGDDVTNRTYFGGAAWFRYLGLDQDTIATRLQNAGYYTAFSGSKYLNLFNIKLLDYTTTTISTVLDNNYVPPGWNAWYVPYHGSHTGYNVWFNSKIDGGPQIKDPVNSNQPMPPGVETPTNSNYSADKIFNRAKQDIDRATAQNKPFFVNIWTSAPHSPFEPADRHKAGCEANPQTIPNTPSFNEDNVADKAPPMRYEKLNANKLTRMHADYSRRLCSLKAVDEGIQGLVNHLDQVPGRLANTFIVFVSDNGFLLGRHRRYGKSIAYEESARVPFFVRGPGVPGAGVAVNQRRANGLTTMTDVSATFLALAGQPIGPLMEGRSLVQAFQNPPLFNNSGSTRKVVLLEGNTSAVPEQAVTPTNGVVAAECLIPPAPTATSSQAYINEYQRAKRNYWGLRTDTFTYIRYCNSDGQGFDPYPVGSGIRLAHRELYNNVTDRWQVSSLLEQPPHYYDPAHPNRVHYWSVATGQLPQAVNPLFVKELDDRIDAMKSCVTPADCRALEDAPFVYSPY